MNAGQPPERIFVRASGDFDAQVAPGNYTVTVMSGGDVIKTELISIRDGLGVLSIRMPEVKTTPRTETGVISVARMKHKVPKDAQKEYKRAQKKFESGDIDGSLAHLKRATELDEEYLEAWNNLGCRYMMKHQFMDALVALRRAAALDKHAPFVHTNMSIAYLSMRDLPAAETAARDALSIDPSDHKGRLILGLSLVSQQKYTDEALKVLRQVEDQFPIAKLALADALARRGSVEQAKAVLQSYLTNSPDSKSRPEAEAMLSALK
jgi:tetratricopeptide (TPR) repeat protein